VEKGRNSLRDCQKERTNSCLRGLQGKKLWGSGEKGGAKKRRRNKPLRTGTLGQSHRKKITKKKKKMDEGKGLLFTLTLRVRRKYRGGEKMGGGAEVCPKVCSVHLAQVFGWIGLRH